LEKQAAMTTKVEVETNVFDEITHCPINKEGE
jgi:hypothetical protein